MNSRKLAVIKIVTAACLLICSVCGANVRRAIEPKNANFNEFLRRTLVKFGEAAEDTISVSPPSTFDVSISNALVTVEGELSDVEYSGLSRISADYVTSDVGGQKCRITGALEKPVITGTYNLTGTIAAVRPIGGAGNFTIQYDPDHEEPGLLLMYLDFTAPEGYVILDQTSSYFIFYFSGYFNDYLQAEFPGLIDSSVDEEVAKEVNLVIGAHLRDLLSPYLQVILGRESLDFFQAAFNETLLYDIISGDIPPRS